MIVYLDLMFFQNMLMGYLVLYLIKTDLYPEISLWRVGAGAMLSSITYIFGYWIGILKDREIALFSAFFFMSIILVWTFRIYSFSMYRKSLEKMLQYTFVSGGICLIYYEGCSPQSVNNSSCHWKSAGIMVVFTVLCTVWKRRKRKEVHFEKLIYDVEIQRHSKTIFQRGFYDSGNLLVSQITGRGICVIAMEDVKDLLDEEEKELLEKIIDDNILFRDIFRKKKNIGIYIIRYSSIGKEEGCMPGIIADHIIVKKKEKILVDRKGMLGISAQKISKDGRFTILLPADIFAMSNNHSILLKECDT